MPAGDWTPTDEHPRAFERGLLLDDEIEQEGVARLWATADEQEVASLIGHRGGVYAAAFTPDSERLVSASLEDRTVRLRDLPPVCHLRKEGPAGPADEGRAPPALPSRRRQPIGSTSGP